MSATCEPKRVMIPTVTGGWMFTTSQESLDLFGEKIILPEPETENAGCDDCDEWDYCDPCAIRILGPGWGDCYCDDCPDRTNHNCDDDCDDDYDDDCDDDVTEESLDEQAATIEKMKQFADLWDEKAPGKTLGELVGILRAERDTQ